MSIQDCDLIQIINSGCDNAVKLSSNVRKKISGPSELKIKASPELLQIVFANLASNSIEATEGNEAREINIAVRESDANAIIDFEDNGSGVPENIRKTLFNPFVTSSKNSSGIGLGLPIVRQILAKHKGGIIYDDSFKPGARFVITLQKNHD
jgi:signal transduction histidine kinase